MQRLLALSLTTLLFANTTLAFEFTTTIPAPRGATPEIDGKITKSEWHDAVKVELFGGGKLLLKHDGKYLYLAVIGKKPGIAHISIEKEDRIAILHASAALGTAEYTGNFRRAHLERQFDWQARGDGMSRENRKERQRFLNKEGWIANVSRKPSHVREFQIDLKFAGESARIPLSVAHLSVEEWTVAFWPEDLSDDSKLDEMVAGDTPETAKFQPQTWPVITVESSKK